MNTIRIGTRKSKLAVWQARFVAKKLEDAGLSTKIVTMETLGDKVLDRSLSKVGSKGLFTQELEEGLREGSIHIAVHSAKDVQATLPEDFELIAFTEREEVADVALSSHRDIDLERQSIVIGTSSVRRTAFLRHYYPNLEITDMRGNLQTRIRKMEEGHCDALLLAYAGVHRMGYNQMIVHKLPIEHFVPAVGQGSLAIEASSQLDVSIRDQIRLALNHEATEKCLLAERAFLKKLEGGCSIPAFALATNSSNELKITGGVISPDGTQLVKKEQAGFPEACIKLGEELGEDVLSAGGADILSQIRQ